MRFKPLNAVPPTFSFCEFNFSDVREILFCVIWYRDADSPKRVARKELDNEKRAAGAISYKAGLLLSRIDSRETMLSTVFPSHTLLMSQCSPDYVAAAQGSVGVFLCDPRRVFWTGHRQHKTPPHGVGGIG